MAGTASEKVRLDNTVLQLNDRVMEYYEPCQKAIDELEKMDRVLITLITQMEPQTETNEHILMLKFYVFLYLLLMCIYLIYTFILSLKTS